MFERRHPSVDRARVKDEQRQPRKSLRGLWRGLEITKEDIAEACQEMWGNFPKDDIA